MAENFQRHRQAWTQDEIQKLHRLAAKGMSLKGISKAMTRSACFHVPMFPLAARLRSEPNLLQEALVIIDGNGNNAHVVAATRRARTKGIRPGFSPAQARAPPAIS